MDTYAADLAELVKALDLKKAIHIGHSTGGGEVARYIGRFGTKLVAKTLLVLSTMHYPDEIRKLEGIGLPSSEVKLCDRELEMADLLVKSMSGEFQPTEFQGTYRKELLEMIRAKAEGEGAEDQPVEAKLLPTNVIDLVARLKASIDQAEEQKKVKTAERISHGQQFWTNCIDLDDTGGRNGISPA